MNKHYTFQEWLEECQSFQDTYEKYFEMQKELENLNEKLSLALESAEKRIDETIASIELGYVVFCKQDEECVKNFRKNVLKILKGDK